MGADRRTPVLTEEDLGNITLALKKSLGIDYELHREQHKWISEKMLHEMEAKDMRDKVMTHIIGWGVVSFISGLGFLIYQGIANWVRKL